MATRAMRTLDPRRLETFRVVAQSGQVSAAARLLNLSQPAVTAQIRMLEAETGQPLFIRRVTGMQLTDHGRLLLDYARRIHHLLDEASERIHGEQAMGGELRLGASTTIAAHILPRVLKDFLRSHHPASVALEVGNTDKVLSWIREGRIALGLVEGLTRAPGVSMDPYLQDELVPVRAAHGPAHLAEIRKASDLAAVPMIWREPGSGTRAVVERAFRKARMPVLPKPSDLVVGDTESIKSCVLIGLGIGFLSRWSIQRELLGGSLEVIPLADLRILRSFSWVQGGGGLAGQPAAFLRWASGHPPLLKH